MIQWLGGLAARLEGLGLVPSAHMVAHEHLDSCVRGTVPPSDLCGCLHSRGVLTHTQAHTHIHKIKRKDRLKEQGIHIRGHRKQEVRAVENQLSCTGHCSGWASL